MISIEIRSTSATIVLLGTTEVMLRALRDPNLSVEEKVQRVVEAEKAMQFLTATLGLGDLSAQGGDQ